MNGGGFPMRFADLDGTLIDVYQAEHEHDRRVDDRPSRRPIDALLDNAVGPLGLLRRVRREHAHRQPRAACRAPRRSSPRRRRAACRVISYKQLLDWVDGRNSSTIRGLNWNAGTFTFVTTVGAGANGLQTMLPTAGPDRAR